MNKEISARVQGVFNKVKGVATRCGRSFSEITIVGVSKRQPIEALQDAFSAGVLNFGENRPQEFRDKFGLLDIPVDWHFIGHLQKNKIKYVLGKVSLIHSVDSLELARELNDRSESAGITTNILLELKVSEEAAKTGIAPAEFKGVVADCKQMKSINVQGLMAMSTFTEDVSLVRSQFAEARRHFEDIRQRFGAGFKFLSMGMSGDFEIAIEEGSNMVRIGTAIFGPRS